jgi:hypothetical protein
MRYLNPRREDYALHTTNIVDIIAALGRYANARNGQEHIGVRTLSPAPEEEEKLGAYSKRLAMETKSEKDRLDQILEFDAESHRQAMTHIREYIDLYIDVTGADQEVEPDDDYDGD